MTKINIENTAVESREQRLGTIVSWYGKASELSEISQYSKGGGCGGGKGRRCTICEASGPFSQASGCTDAMAECQAGNIRDAVLIKHAPLGCSSFQVALNTIYRYGLAMRGHKIENVTVTSTNLREDDMVFGGIDKLRLTVEDVWDRYHPKAIFIGAACATAIIGDDIDSVAIEYGEKLGIPVIPMHCEGFRSKHWSTGFDASQHGILRSIVRKNPEKKQEDLVNVISLWGSDVFTPMLKNLNLRVNYVVDMASVEDLAQTSEAAATVAFCNTLGTYLSEGLEQHYGVPQVRATQPYGIKGTDEWIRALAKLTHREELAEEYIAREHARIEPIIDGLRKQLAGLSGFVATGSAYAHGMMCVLRELGITLKGSQVFHHDPIYDSEDPAQDTLAFLVDNYGDIEDFTVSVRQPYQFYTTLKKVKPDFITIRHNGLAPVASRLGIPSIPLGDEHQAIGYQGVINMGFIILAVMKRQRFHQDLAKHVKSPYSQWWTAQTDANILSKHPELIWDDVSDAGVSAVKRAPQPISEGTG
ncbi:MAG: hypothetical protein LBT41_05455 [Candidatus Methanoplasma sp.]|jgi:nitrogenase molybdenum-iron protein alpha chain|nr:hypothetical protein [Candidatus Methanoplasma sp.]